MRVLIVARCKQGHYAPFITEQVEALSKRGIDCTFFPILNKGIIGYIQRIPAFFQTIRNSKPDIIHAHYGLSGLFSNIQRKIPVVTTFHGSDINNPQVLPFSKITIRLSAFSIFVSNRILQKAHPQKNYSMIPCGINLDDYPFVEKQQARLAMGLNSQTKYVLFAGSFDNRIKNPSLAKESIQSLKGVKLLELKGFSRKEVALLMQAVDVLLMTSYSEGSPQVIKEAMACGCPIVSVDVGDVPEMVQGIEGCYIVKDASATNLTRAIKQALSFQGRTTGLQRILAKGLTNELIAQQLYRVYQQVS